MMNIQKNIKIVTLILFLSVVFSFNLSLAQIQHKFLPIVYDVGCIDAVYELRLGSKDYALFGDVLLLQTFLFQNNIMTHAPTGYFGPITQNSLKNYQSLRNLYPTGVFDANTRKAVARDTCELTEIKNNIGNIGYYPNQNSVSTPQYPTTQYLPVNYQVQTQGQYINLTEQMIFPQ